MGHCIARAANCKRRLLGISMLFLNLFIFEKQKKTVEIPAVRALIIFVF